jgi:hypothetical protein
MKELLQKLHSSKLEIGKVAKNAKNPHFKNTYADLNALIEAVEPILLEKGLVLLQPIKEGRVFTVIADIENGEQIESFIDLPTTGTPQAMGSAITYYRRYTLQSLLSLQAVDDDGHTASQPQAVQQKPTISEKAFGQAIERISNGERDLILKISNAYNLTPQQAVELNELV